MPKLGKVSAEKVICHKLYGTARKALRIKDVARKGTPREAATAFLRSIAPQLKIPADLGNLKCDKAVKSPLGTHLLFRQCYDKKPITSAWVKVDLDPQNCAYHFHEQHDTSADAREIAEESRQASLERGGGEKESSCGGEGDTSRMRGKVTSELVNFPVGKTVEPAWKFLIPVSAPPHDWRIYISADNGSVLLKEDMIKTANGKGMVFDPNPVVRLNNTTLKASKPISDAAYEQVPLRGIASTGFLDGPYVSTSITKKRAKSTNGIFFSKDIRADLRKSWRTSTLTGCSVIFKAWDSRR